MSKFKVGDRVSFDAIKHFSIGTEHVRGVFLGTVQIVRDGLIGVEFDDDIHGHNLFDDLEVGCTPGHGWYFFGDDFLDPLDGEETAETNVEIDPDILFY